MRQFASEQQVQAEPQTRSRNPETGQRGGRPEEGARRTQGKTPPESGSVSCRNQSTKCPTANLFLFISYSAEVVH